MKYEDVMEIVVGYPYGYDYRRDMLLVTCGDAMARGIVPPTACPHGRGIVRLTVSTDNKLVWALLWGGKRRCVFLTAQMLWIPLHCHCVL